MFDFKTAKELGQLGPPPEGWSEVQGACTDRHGNVYFANTVTSTIDEYTHDGSYMATLSDAGQYPVGCSYDTSSENLAISNIISTSGGQGSVSIFHGGALQNTYYPSNMARVYFLGYQGTTGTLWLDGSNSSGIFAYDKFAAGTFTPVPISGGTIGFPGGVQWSAKTNAMNVGDQAAPAPTIYQVAPSGKIVGSTVLACGQPSGVCDSANFIIKGPWVVASAYPSVALFAYPAGGMPVRFFGQNLNSPIGLAISSGTP